MTPVTCENHRRGWNAWEVARWPPLDATAWHHARRAGGPLDRGGPASALAPATVRCVLALYGMYLAWLDRQGELDREASPQTRFTFALVGRFIRERRASVSDNSVYINLGMLAMMLNCMLPGQDWGWVRRHTAAPSRWEAQAARRPQPMFDPGLLLYRLLQELDVVHALPLTWDVAIRQRDCVLLAVAMYTAVRLRNLLEMRIGHHLLRRGTGWEPLYDWDETKSDVPIATWIPRTVEPALGRYLAEYRPFLLDGGGPTDLMWISGRGAGLSENGMRGAFHRLGMHLLEDHLHPHEVRYVMASTLLAHRPNALGVAAAALGHKATSTVTQYYDRSGFAVAQGVWSAVREKIVRGR